MQLLNVGSLITYHHDNNEHALGYLFSHKGNVFDATLGAVSDQVTEEDADIHNRLFDEALINGLDNCEVGQCGNFYIDDPKKPTKVTTWLGTLVSDCIRHEKQRYLFTRNDRTFKIRRHNGENYVTCTRIA